MTGIIEFSSDTLNIEVSGVNNNIPIDLVEVISTGQDVYINVESSQGVLAINGRQGFVILDKSDVGLQNVENISILNTSGHLQYQIDQLDTGYASQAEINLLSGNLITTGLELINLINGLSGYGQSSYYPINNPSGFITGINLSNYYTIDNPSGFITGIDLSNYATLNNLASTGQSLQNQIDNLDNIYTTDTILTQTGQLLDQKINNLSGYFNEENILEYTKELTSGNETEFLEYPFYLSSPPSSVTCSFQNLSDNVIYNYVIGKITSSGFYVSFSDILTNTGYFLLIKIKK